MDELGAALGFVVPGICLALVGAYALFDLRTRRGESGQLVSEGAH
jgi:FHS family L-fucose permease-like MFS transporter